MFAVYKNYAGFEYQDEYIDYYIYLKIVNGSKAIIDIAQSG